MSEINPIAAFQQALRAQGVAVQDDRTGIRGPVQRLSIAAADWGPAARVAADLGGRWAGLWGDPKGDACRVHACLIWDSACCVLETEVTLADAGLASHTPWYPGANRLERHATDLLGIRFEGHPQADQRWTRHQAWQAGTHPLHPDSPAGGTAPKRTPADTGYPFVRVQGSGVYEIPVGPVHAGIIEPGHFRFQAVGEEILALEERLGYVHKGIEKLAVGSEPEHLARLAGRISGDTTVAHAWAACQAMERAVGAEVPPRGLALRALLTERERVANHLGDIGAICNDVGFTFMHVQCARLREHWQRRSKDRFGHRLLMDTVVPGGVARDLPEAAPDWLREDHRWLRAAVAPLFEILGDHPSLEDRLLGTGLLSLDDARALGCTGYVARASGLGFDVRRNQPYAPYDRLDVEVPVREEGDVAARVEIRVQELLISLELMDRLLDQLPAGAVRASLPTPAADAAGLGIVEGWRGEILTFVRFGPEGRVERFFPRDPSWFLWPALERLIHGNIVADFPVCNKSVNGSYSGHDL